ncbi:MAG: hypothetical protein O3A01_03020 [bacterium]|nr:hypothetical protein [bacterium]
MNTMIFKPAKWCVLALVLALSLGVSGCKENNDVLLQKIESIAVTGIRIHRTVVEIRDGQEIVPTFNVVAKRTQPPTPEDSRFFNNIASRLINSFRNQGFAIKTPHDFNDTLSYTAFQDTGFTTAQNPDAIYVPGGYGRFPKLSENKVTFFCDEIQVDAVMNLEVQFVLYNDTLRLDEVQSSPGIRVLVHLVTKDGKTVINDYISAKGLQASPDVISKFLENTVVVNSQTSRFLRELLSKLVITINQRIEEARKR